MQISSADREILRDLGKQIAAAAADEQNEKRREMWRKLNDFEKVRPMLWINEVPWQEMNVNDELTLKTESPFCRSLENQMRQTLYQWNHFPGDMIVDPWIYCRLAIRDTGFGIQQLGQVDASSGAHSQEFTPQIKTLEDVEKIRIPEVTLDTKASEEQLETLQDLFGEIIDVRPYGIGMQWFTLWDNLIRWYGVQEALMDLVLNPELVHAALARLLEAFLARLRQYRELNVFSLCNGNFRVGSGGLGYTRALPAPGFDPAHVRPQDQWGCGNAQIFSEVSPEMHEEFSLRYEREWLKNFGLNYYGCCEQLHHKIAILESIPNLRKVSMSPWCNVEKMVETVNGRYILSHKPNPAILARPEWNPVQARKELTDVLNKTRNCGIEVILKDISTVHQEPVRLWEWTRIATEVCEEFAE